MQLESEVPGLPELIDSYLDVFARQAADLGQFEWAQHAINTGEAVPLKLKGRRYSPGEKQAIAGETQRLLDARVIKSSHTPWSANPLLVPKSDGTLWMCVDYRQLNELTIGDAYPMPRADDIFDSLDESSLFTVIDLKSGFHQIPVSERDGEKTAFYTHLGQHEYTKMPFELKNAPATFKELWT